MSSLESLEKEMKAKCVRELKTATDPLEKLRLTLLKRGSGGIKGLGRVFRIMDDDGSKSLSFDEFKKGIRDYGLSSLSNDDIKKMFQRFDVSGEGSISFDEFIVPLRKMSENRKAIVMLAFEKMDATGDGVVTIEDLKKTYSVKAHKDYKNGSKTEDEILTEFLKKYEPQNDRDGKVTTDEFLNYYAGVSASIDSDAYFDVMMRQAWKL